MDGRQALSLTRGSVYYTVGMCSVQCAVFCLFRRHLPYFPFSDLDFHCASGIPRSGESQSRNYATNVPVVKNENGTRTRVSDRHHPIPDFSIEYI